jgi:protein-S-isoprenylcysteine O-methyltransferase Ste14
MPMTEEFKQAGQILFRWRNYFPLTFFVVILASLQYFHYPYGNHLLDLSWEFFCLFIGSLGLIIRILTVAFVPEGTSGRGTTKPSAVRLNTTGMYSIVRNPLYLGNFFTYIAPVLFIRSGTVTLIFLLMFSLYYERIIFAEEIFLLSKFERNYYEWASKTPAFFPKFANWTKPDLPFSWRMAISREYHGVYGLISTLFLLELLCDVYLEKKLVWDPFWICLFTIGTIFYLTVRFLDKKTSLLKIGNR